ncbi:ABC transporter ATP-binding protein [Flavobacterium sp.]|uniref:ABC transporter ATP-binding protein n=1 Tax=Flavobacterium sp. TaxID=239 RepID=UPI002604F3A7|nr:ABC transporter ATP-binding protein [Flavobacterium sp.]
MSKPIIKVENLSKAYQIGQIGSRTLSKDVERFWQTKILGKDDPFLKIGETNNRSVKGTSNIVWSLKDINFEINQGDAVGIIGKNGAGKSTLLKLLSRVTSPTTGQIKVKGRIASLLEVGTGFHPELSGRENIYLNGAILGMRKKEITRKLDEIIDFSGVERYIDTPVKRYSSGMYVRLAFAVAAHLESEILIVDEVLAVGDAEFQKKCLGKMGDISKSEGRTVLFVSHNMAAVQNLCNKGIVLQNGMNHFQGAADKAIQEYLKNSADITSLADYKGRSGTGIVKIINAKIYGENQFLEPQVGQPLHIELELYNPSKIDSSQIRLDLKIDDNLGQRFLWLSNYLFEKQTVNNVTKMIFKIDKLILNQGGYYISTDLYVDYKRADWLQSAIYFEVMDGDYYHTGRNIPVEESKIYLDFDVDFYNK